MESRTGDVAGVYHATAYGHAPLHAHDEWLLESIGQHINAVALHFMYYNFVRIRSSRCVTPAMAVGVMKKHWEIGDIIALIKAEHAGKPVARTL